MKKILVTAIIILFTASVNAQAGMPKEMACTEEAFNFSFSLGTKWKLSTSKMGPVDAIRNDPDYIPSWCLKVKDVKTETYSSPLFSIPFNAEAKGYAINQQNNAPLFYHNSFRMMNKPKYLLHDINFSPLINYTILNPGFQVNSSQLWREQNLN